MEQYSPSWNSYTSVLPNTCAWKQKVGNKTKKHGKKAIEKVKIESTAGTKKKGQTTVPQAYRTHGVGTRRNSG